MNTITYSSGISSSQMRDFMLLLQAGGLEGAAVNDMLTKGKKNYVQQHHSQAITQLHSSNKYKNGTWKTYVRENGARKEVVRKTEEELYDALYEHYKQAEMHLVTFEEAFGKLSEYKRTELGRDSKTVYDDFTYFRRLSESLKKTPLVDVTESELRKWLVTEYLPTKPKETALKKMIGILKQVFEYGIMVDICNDNPARRIDYNTYVKNCNHRKKSDEERAFSADECSKLRDDALSHLNNPRSLIRLLAMETGMRAGELCSLHKSDIDGNFIHIHRQLVKDMSSGHQTFREVIYSKDERQHPHDGRWFPINQKIESILKLVEQLPGESEYLFHDKAGKHVTPDTYELHLRRACDRLGIETSNNHAFRVSVNSKLIEMGFCASDRAMLLGHSVETNERHYSVSDKRRLEEIRQKMQ